MSVTLNGSSGYLEWSKGAGTLPVTALGFTIIARIRTPTWTVNQFAAAFGSSSSDRYAALWADSGARIYANQRNPGNGASAQLPNQSATSMQLAMAVFDGPSSRHVFNGSSSSGADPTTLVDDVSQYDRFTIGSYHTNNNAATFFWTGDIAEVHIFNRALTAADYATLNADFKPETLTGWVDGWPLKNATDLVSITGTRTLTLVGGVTSTGTHPITRATAATAVTLSGPTTGVTGVASANFTVGTDGTASGTVVVTPSDGGAGGTFTPATVSITGTNAATFTYTPASTGVKTIAVTNNAALSNPSNLTYTATSAADTNPPAMTGAITASAITQTTYTISGWDATDDVGVTSFELSLDGGASYTDIGKVTSKNVSGRTAGTTDAVRVRAYDAAGNRSGALSASVTLSAAATATFTSGTLTRNNGVLVGATTLTWLKLINRSTGSDVALKTGVVVNSSSVFAANDSGMTSGTIYAAFWREANGAYGWGEAAAA